MFFLIDLDENPIENKETIMKNINKIILQILEYSENRHMLEVLVLLLKSQLRLGATYSGKIQSLIYKCMGKVIKTPKFADKWPEKLMFVLEETNFMINKYEIKIDSPLAKSIKTMWKNDILSKPIYY